MNVKIAIELDSYTHHIQQLSAADFEYQTRCARFLQNAGWKVFPFCGREVNRGPMRCVEEVRRYLLTNKTAFGRH
jgi:very-short-patch-repair endonuclease